MSPIEPGVRHGIQFRVGAPAAGLSERAVMGVSLKLGRQIALSTHHDVRVSISLKDGRQIDGRTSFYWPPSANWMAVMVQFPQRFRFDDVIAGFVEFSQPVSVLQTQDTEERRAVAMDWYGA